LLQILGAFREWPEYVRQEEVSTVDAIVRALNERTYMTPLYAKYGYMKWLLTQMDD
jgi:hypothetical protein